MHVPSRPNHVVIAGGGVAAVECVLALHDLAGDTPPREMRLWSAAHKIDGKYLSPWLAALENRDATTTPPADHAGDLDLDIALPTGGTTAPVPAG